MCVKGVGVGVTGRATEKSQELWVSSLKSLLSFCFLIKTDNFKRLSCLYYSVIALQTLSVKDQAACILGFADHPVSTAGTQFCPCTMKAAIANGGMNVAVLINSTDPEIGILPNFQVL